MNILLTNDDGFSCLGIQVLAEKLKKQHNVYLVAPSKERSCSAMSASFFEPISYKKIELIDGVECYSVSGTPVDCVLFGLRELTKNIKIDIVISGINTVLNLGSDFLYSGTVGAALEASYLGYKGVAVSVQIGDGKYDDTADFIVDNISTLSKYAKRHTALNVNMPSTKKEEFKGIKMCSIGFREYGDSYRKEEIDGESRYHIQGSPFSSKDSGKYDDVTSLENGYITITPIKLYTTDLEVLNNVDESEFKL